MTQPTLDTAPRYTHDCKICVFLGRRGDDDLYFCPSRRPAVDSTVIARYSSDGPDYASGMAFSYGALESLTAARAIAQARGLASYDLRLALQSMASDAPLVQQEELRKHLVESAVGRALMLISRNDPAGPAALAAFVAEEVAEYRRRVGPDFKGDVGAWAQETVSNAQRWLEQLGAVFVRPTDFSAGMPDA